MTELERAIKDLEGDSQLIIHQRMYRGCQN